MPDDFELPEGYVRHYQTTDDGEQLPAILMFHPDYQFVDENGVAMRAAGGSRRAAGARAAGPADQMLELPASDPDATP